jgi:hypothetical protein
VPSRDRGWKEIDLGVGGDWASGETKWSLGDGTTRGLRLRLREDGVLSTTSDRPVGQALGGIILLGLIPTVTNCPVITLSIEQCVDWPQQSSAAQWLPKPRTHFGAYYQPLASQ